MLRFLPAPLLGTLGCLFWALNTIFWSPFVFVIGIIKFIVPIKPWRIFWTRCLNFIASSWMSCNNVMIRGFLNIKYDVTGHLPLSKNHSYLVISNHQSWADIVVLGAILNHRIPFFKFFLKQSLIYVPILGFAWWALDYPFIKRYTPEQIHKDPELKNKNLEVTQEIFEKYKDVPVSIMNFVEGSRFSIGKKNHLKSPYHFLLPPKSGGIAYTLEIMGKKLNNIIDITVIYPDENPSLWKLLSGKMPRIKVFLREIPVTLDLVGDYSDPQFKAYFQQWLNKHWKEKDELIAREKTK
jgi:1-acyl-sn-glycerol-3-phosphate acyltransferase